MASFAKEDGTGENNTGNEKAKQVEETAANMKIVEDSNDFIMRKMPSVIKTEKGDFIGIRSKIILSHSYDHRVVNGSLGSKFVKFVKEYLENWDTNREI